MKPELSIVDVKARDAQGAIYQIEIQLLRYTDLPTRTLYTWTDLYSQQLHRGDGYNAEYCDRVALMYRSRVIALDTPNQRSVVASTPERFN